MLSMLSKSYIHVFLFTSAKEVMFLPVFVCLFVCLCVSKITQKVMDGSFWNFEGMSGMAHSTSDSISGVIRQESWILDHWNFRYHCVKGGIREPLAKWIWWRHLASNIAFAEVPAGYDCFLVFSFFSFEFWVRSNFNKLKTPPAHAVDEPPAVLSAYCIV